MSFMTFAWQRVVSTPTEDSAGGPGKSMMLQSDRLLSDSAEDVSIPRWLAEVKWPAGVFGPTPSNAYSSLIASCSRHKSTLLRSMPLRDAQTSGDARGDKPFVTVPDCTPHVVTATKLVDVEGTLFLPGETWHTGGGITPDGACGGGCGGGYDEGKQGWSIPIGLNICWLPFTLLGNIPPCGQTPGTGSKPGCEPAGRQNGTAYPADCKVVFGWRYLGVKYTGSWLGQITLSEAAVKGLAVRGGQLIRGETAAELPDCGTNGDGNWRAGARCLGETSDGGGGRPRGVLVIWFTAGSRAAILARTVGWLEAGTACGWTPWLDTLLQLLLALCWRPEEDAAAEFWQASLAVLLLPMFTVQLKLHKQITSQLTEIFRCQLSRLVFKYNSTIKTSE